MWCEDVVSYHERGRLRPEGVKVIAHVHYACESYTGRHRGVHMTMAMKVARGTKAGVPCIGGVEPPCGRGIENGLEEGG